MFENYDASGTSKVLDRQALKAIGVLPSSDAAEPPPELDDSNSSVLRQSSRVIHKPVQTNQRYRIPGEPSAVLDNFASLHLSEAHANDPETVLIALTENQLQSITPKSAEQALHSASHSQWLAAMNREKHCHVKNGTFGEEWKGDGRCKAIPAGWVLRIKHRGEPIRKRLGAKAI